METEVAVVGGGIAGLTCGWELLKRGRDVRVFEPENVGGLIRSSQVGGYLVEQGPNVLLGRPALLELISRLGLVEDIAWPTIPHYRQYIWDGTRPVSVPRGLLALMKSPLATVWEKCAILRGVLSPRALSQGRSSGDTIDASVVEFLAPVMGERIIRSIADTTLKGIYGGTVERLSARSLFPGLWEAAQGGSSLLQYMRAKQAASGGPPKILTLIGGNATLPRRLENELASQLVRSSVISIARADNKFVLGTAHGEEWTARSVVVACPGGAASQLIRSIDDGAAAALASVRRAPLVVVHLAAPRSGGTLPERGFGVLFPRGEPSRLLGVMFNSALFPHQAPRDGHLLTVCLGGIDGDDILDEEEGHLVGRVVTLIERRLGLSGLSPLLVTRWPGAIPQYEVGHWRVCDAIKAMELRVDGVRFGGADRGGIGVADRVAEGLRIARELSC
jgi:oxygen-dependent protoporphyrinogen oxidase